MRTARKKLVGRDCYYHLCNRMAGPRDEYPLTDVDKERAFRIVEDLSRLFFIDVLSVCWMGNHWHMVCFAPCESPSLEEVASRHNRYYGKRKPTLSLPMDEERLEELADQLIDISQFMRQINQRFTFYFNRAHNRRGSVWADRFKSTILEGRNAVWNCVKYVELNPVRAGLVSDPADYRFCSWGRFSGSGKHPFAASFETHMRGSWPWADTSEWSDEDVYAEFRGELTRVMAAEAGLSSEEIHEAAETARTQRDSMQLRFLRRTRHWTDGAIIGSKAWVQEIGCQFEDRKRVMDKQLSRGLAPSGEVLHCFKRLRPEPVSEIQPTNTPE